MAPKKIQTSPIISNNFQQDIDKDFYLLQIENQELAKTIKDLYQRINQLLNSMEIIKKLQIGKFNIRIGIKSESAFTTNSWQNFTKGVNSKEIQKFGICKTEQPQILNDPMEIEQQPSTSENPYQKLLIPIGDNDL